MPPTTPLIVTHADAARILGVAPRTLLEIRRQGKIRFVRISDGRKGIRYSVRDLEAWVAWSAEQSGQAVEGGAA